ncbi:hypothetical protein [Phreatobacter sp.]|nr:hypothetical protein [Phreatobacter sp.]
MENVVVAKSAMAGLAPAINDLITTWQEFVDARHEAGHDVVGGRGFRA